MTRGIYGNKRRSTGPTGNVWLGPRPDPMRPDFWVPPTPVARVGAGEGSILGHTPGDVEDEIDELLNEIMTFDAELASYVRATVGKTSDAELDRLLKEQADDVALTEKTAPFRREVYRLEKLLSDATPADFPALALELRDAQLKADQVMPREERINLRVRIQSRAEKIRALRAKLQADADPDLHRYLSTWDAFRSRWMAFHSQKTTIPMQMLPFSGTWDRIQEYRKQFVELLKEAPFTPTITPLDPDTRKDPSILGSIGDALSSIGTLGKVVIYGGLGLIAAVAVTSIVQQVRKNKDPLETYSQLMRMNATAAARTARAVRGG